MTNHSSSELNKLSYRYSIFSETAAKITARYSGTEKNAKMLFIKVIIVHRKIVIIKIGILIFNSKSSFNLKNMNFFG